MCARFNKARKSIKEDWGGNKITYLGKIITRNEEGHDSRWKIKVRVLGIVRNSDSVIMTKVMMKNKVFNLIGAYALQVDCV